jgi:adenosylcobinamide kinase/adenosylcobinamide-phosphate guanylyltransferase
MAEIVLITGGQRSGKSSFATKMAEDHSSAPVYMATSRVWDEDFRQRIIRHKKDRGEQWETIEEEKYLHQYDLENRSVVVDCVTLWLNNFFYDNNYDADSSLQQAKSEWDLFRQQKFNLFVVTNELGMGVHAENEASRKFADLQGWMNQYIAKHADRVFLMVSGISTQIK